MSQPPRVLFNFTEDDIADSAPSHEQKIDNVILDVVKELCESDREDILLDDVEDVKEDTLNLPSIDREQIVQEEIFDVIAEAKKVTEKVKPVKKKRQLSEEHKAKLALAREKALVTRRAKAEEKIKMKAIENETKELKKKKATKELESLKEEVNNDKPLQANPTSKTPSAMPQQFTLKDLEQAQLSAIMSYEQVRKARKEEKKKQKMIEEQQQKLKSQINNFTKPQSYGARDANGMLINKWHGCY